MAALLPWWILISFLSLIALPVTLSLFRNLPDRGYPLARVLGIFLPAFLAWFLGICQLATYGSGLFIFALVIVAGISGILLWKDRSLLHFFREHWRLVLFYELLFAAALVAGAILRIYGPWGGAAIAHTEQPMDFAFMNGIIQSRTLPPQDPWLSGYPINYYYMGYFQAASLTLLSGLPSSVVFNLNLALIFALSVSGCFSLGYNLTVAAAPSNRGRAVVVGILAVLFAMIVGNQGGALQVIAGSSQAMALDTGEMWTVLKARLAGETGVVDLGHMVYAPGEFGDRFDKITPTPGWQVDDFNWWWPSRVLWDERPSLEAIQQISATGQVGRALFLGWRDLVSPDQIHRSYAITEFPFFSFYLGDMHPHVMSLPLTLSAMALALNVLLAPERGRPALGPGRWSWLFLVVTAIVLGGLYMANSWDFPTYLLLYAAAWIWRWRKETANGWTRKDTLAIARDLGLLAGLCILLYLPFFLTFRSLVGSKEIPAQILQVPILGTLANLPILRNVFQTIWFVSWDKTSLYTLLVIFGFFLYPAMTWLAAKGIEQWLPVRRWGPVLLGAGVALIFVLLAVFLSFPFLVLVPILMLGWKLLGTRKPAEALALLVLMLALLLILGCDIVYIRDAYESRMNTIFKFYYQAWILLAIVGAWAVGELARTHLRKLYALLPWGIPLLLLLAGGLVYPVLSLRLAFKQQRDWNLDGLINMQRHFPGDYAGVRWLSEHAEPDAVILEAIAWDWDPNRGRISMATGRPTILGWYGHEDQWRGGDPEARSELGPRFEAVERLFNTADPVEARLLLQEYHVDYVFIGSQELSYPPENLAKFAQLGTLVFEAPGVQIYRISHQSSPGP